MEGEPIPTPSIETSITPESPEIPKEKPNKLIDKKKVGVTMLLLLALLLSLGLSYMVFGKEKKTDQSPRSLDSTTQPITNGNNPQPFQVEQPVVPPSQANPSSVPQATQLTPAETCTEISYGLCITPSAGWTISDELYDNEFPLVGVKKSFESSFNISKYEGMGYSTSGSMTAGEGIMQSKEDYSFRFLNETYSTAIGHYVIEETGYERYIFSFYADKLPEPVYVYSKVGSLKDLEAVKEMISSIKAR